MKPDLIAEKIKFKHASVQPFVYRQLTLEKDGMVGLLAIPVSESQSKEKENASND